MDSGAGVDSAWEQEKLEATRTRNARSEGVHALLANFTL